MIDEFLRRFGSDCLAPLRLVVLGGAISFVQLFATQKYSKQAGDKREQGRRLAVLLPSVGSLFAATFVASCVMFCATSPPCPRGYDLNCDGRNPEVYEAVAMGLVVGWAAFLTWEAAWRVIHRRRNGEA